MMFFIRCYKYACVVVSLVFINDLAIIFIRRYMYACVVVSLVFINDLAISSHTYLCEKKSYASLPPLSSHPGSAPARQPLL